MSTSDTPEPLRNDALEDLKNQNVDDLVTPDEIVFRGITEPEPTDAIGSEDWDDDEPRPDAD